MYTRPQDYKLYCDTVTLAQVVNADLSLKRLCEYAAEDQIKSELGQRYDFAMPYGEFSDTNVWSNTTIYKGGNRVYLDAPAYNATLTYALGVQTLENGNVYICSTLISAPEAFTIAHWTLLGAQYDLFYITYPQLPWNFQTNYTQGNQIWYKDNTYTSQVISINIPPDSQYGSTYWGTGTPYTVVAGTLPTDISKWTAGDNRNNYLLQLYITIVVYNMFMKIAPKNIQQVRVDQYKMAMEWLDKAGAGKVTAGLPLLIPEQGSSIRWGSVAKTNNLY